MKKENFVHGSYFNGQKISDYGLKNGYVDFATFCHNINMVMNNDLLQNLEGNGYDFENINYQSYDSEIMEKEAEYQDNENKIDSLNSFLDNEEYSIKQWENIKKQISDIENEQFKITADLNELYDQQKYAEYPDIFQYFITDQSGADLFTEYTEYPVFYCETLDLYIVGITHFGTNWDYVLTDIKCNVPYEK